MSEARNVRDTIKQRILLEQTLGAYELWQMPTGLAGYYDNPNGKASGAYAEFTTFSEAILQKTTGFVALKGNRAYWDHSANAINYKKVNDRDFYVGRFSDNAISAADECAVHVGIDPPYDLDIARDPFLTTYAGTQGLNTMGIFRRGGAHKMILSTTNEAQKFEMLSVDGFAKGANAIIEGAFRVISDGAGTAPDFNIGIGNATHATDADSIAEHMFIHLDGNALDIFAQSKDGTTTVAATDTTINYAEGSAVANRVEFWIDMRNPASVTLYINGSQVLAATTFNLDAIATTMFLLAHLEKTAAADVYEIDVDWLRAHFAEQ